MDKENILTEELTGLPGIDYNSIQTIATEDLALTIISGEPFFSSSQSGNFSYYSLTGEEFPDYNSALSSVVDSSLSNDSKSDSAIEIIKEVNNDTTYDLIQLISDYLKIYIYMESEEEYILLSTYIILTYCFNLFSRIPYLNVRGKKGSGKTTLMLVLKELVCRPKIFSSVTDAAIFRVVNSIKPTLFLDEVEHLNKKSAINSITFQIINSGYQKDGKAARTIKGDVVEFSTFCPKVLAAINPPTPTIEARCFVLVMKIPTSKGIIPFTNSEQDKILAFKIKNQIISWLKNNAKVIYSLVNNPEGLSIDPEIRNRDLDKWYSIFVIAKVLSSNSRDYYRELSEYARLSIIKKMNAESDLPENKSRHIIIDFIKANKKNRSKILKIDKLFYYVSAEEFYDEINLKDHINVYNSQADVTKALKIAGINSSRQRFRSNPVIVYRVPLGLIQE